MAQENKGTRPPSPRPGVLTAAQVRTDEDGRQWVLVGLTTPSGRMQALIDPLDLEEIAPALQRFADLDQLPDVAKPKLALPGEDFDLIP